MKKVIIFVVLFALIVVLSKWDTIWNALAWDDSLSFEENLSLLNSIDEDRAGSFIGHYSMKYNAMHKSLYSLGGKKYSSGNIIIDSAQSKEEAVRICTQRYTSAETEERIGQEVLECKVVYESDILYGVYVKWNTVKDGQSDLTYEEYTISFKKDVVDIVNRHVNGQWERSFVICTDREDQIEKILLYLYPLRGNGVPALDVYYETQYNDREFVLTVYSYKANSLYYADWGWEPDHYIFYKQDVVLDRATGSVTFREPVELRTIYATPYYV